MTLLESPEGTRVWSLRVSVSYLRDYVKRYWGSVLERSTSEKYTGALTTWKPRDKVVEILILNCAASLVFDEDDTITT